MSELSINAFADKLSNFADRAVPKLIDIYTKALSNLDAILQNRIFNEHKDSKDAKIGSYSTKPTLIGAKSFRSTANANSFFKEQKKNKDSKWRKVKGNSLLVLDGGYKEYRALDKLPNNEVNFQRTGELLKTGIVKKISDGKFQLVFSNKLSENKIRGFEERRGKLVAEPTPKESEETIDYINEQTQFLLTELL